MTRQSVNRQVPVVDDFLVIDIVWESTMTPRLRVFASGAGTVGERTHEDEGVPKTRVPAHLSVSRCGDSVQGTCPGPLRG